LPPPLPLPILSDRFIPTQPITLIKKGVVKQQQHQHQQQPATTLA